MNLARVIRLYPTKEQARLLTQTADATRYVWNYLLEKNSTYYALAKVCEGKGKFYSFADMTKALPSLKRNNPWIDVGPAISLVYVCRQLDRAMRHSGKNQKHRKGFAKFKSRKHSKQSFTVCNQQTTVVGDHLKIGKIGLIRYRGNAMIEGGKLMNCTISQDKCGDWFAALAYETPDTPLVPSTDVMGIDMGLSALMTLSDGTKIENPRFARKAEKKLARLQRRMSKKKKGSKNREKARRRLARASRRVARQRKDYIHKATTSVIAKSSAIAIEDLNVKGMKSGKSRFKRGLRRSLADASIAEVLFQLTYKAEKKGISVIKADRFFPSSQICSDCGGRQPMPLHEREYACGECGVVKDRDVNAAINLSKLGSGWPEAKAAVPPSTPVEIPLSGARRALRTFRLDMGRRSRKTRVQLASPTLNAN